MGSSLVEGTLKALSRVWIFPILFLLDLLARGVFGIIIDSANFIYIYISIVLAIPILITRLAHWESVRFFCFSWGISKGNVGSQLELINHGT